MSVEVHRSNIQLSEWSEKHNVIPELLPLDYRTYNSIDVLQLLYEHFQSWPQTKQTWSVKELPIAEESIRSNHIGGIPLPVFAGSYRVSSSGRQDRWTNPNYIHEQALVEVYNLPDMDMIERYASIWLVPQREVAKRLDCSYKTVHKRCVEHGRTWGERRSEGRKRFVRTCKTIKSWGYASYRELSQIFGLGEVTVANQCRELEQDFEPPDEPIINC